MVEGEKGSPSQAVDDTEESVTGCFSLFRDFRSFGGSLLRTHGSLKYNVRLKMTAHFTKLNAHFFKFRFHR